MSESAKDIIKKWWEGGMLKAKIAPSRGESVIAVSTPVGPNPEPEEHLRMKEELRKMERIQFLRNSQREEAISHAMLNSIIPPSYSYDSDPINSVDANLRQFDRNIRVDNGAYREAYHQHPLTRIHGPMFNGNMSNEELRDFFCRLDAEQMENAVRLGVIRRDYLNDTYVLPDGFLISASSVHSRRQAYDETYETKEDKIKRAIKIKKEKRRLAKIGAENSES